MAMNMLAAIRGKKGDNADADELTRPLRKVDWPAYAEAAAKVTAKSMRFLEVQARVNKLFDDHHTLQPDDRQRLLEAEKADLKPDYSSAATADALLAAQRELSVVKEAVASLERDRDNLTWAAADGLVHQYDLKAKAERKLQRVLDALIQLQQAHEDLEAFRALTDEVKIALPTDVFYYLPPGNPRNPNSMLAPSLKTARDAGYSLSVNGSKV
jgi:hypothetical protein